MKRAQPAWWPPDAGMAGPGERIVRGFGPAPSYRKHAPHKNGRQKIPGFMTNLLPSLGRPRENESCPADCFHRKTTVRWVGTEG